MQRKELRQNVLDNFEHDKDQKHRRSPYVKVDADTIFRLLNGVSGKNKTEATRLLKHLATHRWHIHYTAHEGGSDPNAPWHITLMAPRGIHLNCKQKDDDTLYVYEITWSKTTSDRAT